MMIVNLRLMAVSAVAKRAFKGITGIKISLSPAAVIETYDTSAMADTPLDVYHRLALDFMGEWNALSKEPANDVTRRALYFAFDQICRQYIKTALIQHFRINCPLETDRFGRFRTEEDNDVRIDVEIDRFGGPIERVLFRFSRRGWSIYKDSEYERSSASNR